MLSDWESLAKKLDQFYTKDQIADSFFREFIEPLDDGKFLFLEPSAWTGAFFRKLPKDRRFGLDLEPKSPWVVRWDFFEIDFKTILWWKGDIIAVWNPPFWKNSSLALKFLNTCGKFSKYVCFILPKTFKKNSFKNKIDENLHLVSEKDVPKDSFTINGRDCNVPCVFQVWKRCDIKREKIVEPIEHRDFIFVGKMENPDFAIRRVWVRAWTVIEDFEKFKEASHYYVRTIRNKREVLSILKSLDLREVAWNTAGNPSLSKREIIAAYQKVNVE